MYGELGIFAMSPELALDDRRTWKFFIKEPEVIETTVKRNQVWINFALGVIFESVDCEHSSSDQISNILKNDRTWS